MSTAKYYMLRFCRAKGCVGGAAQLKPGVDKGGWWRRSRLMSIRGRSIHFTLWMHSAQETNVKHLKALDDVWEWNSLIIFAFSVWEIHSGHLFVTSANSTSWSPWGPSLQESLLGDTHFSPWGCTQYFHNNEQKILIESVAENETSSTHRICENIFLFAPFSMLLKMCICKSTGLDLSLNDAMQAKWLSYFDMHPATMYKGGERNMLLMMHHEQRVCMKG